MTTTVITGASGFIAQHVARVLRRTRPGRLVGVDIRPSSGSGFDSFHVADLTDRAATQGVLEASVPDVVYHMAGVVRGSEALVHASNVETTRNVLDVLRTVAPRARVVLVGSAAEYGVVPVADQPVVETADCRPTGAYGRAKAEVTALATEAFRDFGQHVGVARPFNVMGAGVPDAMVGGAIAHRLRSALASPAPRTIALGRTDAIRDFVDAEDVGSGLVAIAERGSPGGVYNLCTGVGHSIQELLDELLALAGEPITVTRDETLVRHGDVDALVGSCEKARHELEWNPTTSFHESIRRTWEASDPRLVDVSRTGR